MESFMAIIGLVKCESAIIDLMKISYLSKINQDS